ncbi:MAG TPA: right-handed parallel beta-helix repeat-containing protein [Permianibacter sp.]|nr:right-handed parallel beta-helix repeat-containing protein [Permianibacter sp.]
MNKLLRRYVSALVTSVTLCGASPFALAVDGVVLIDQGRALAGNVTPGDAPGFPVSITRSGSYRLSSQLVLPANRNINGIEISNNATITLDLNGFAIVGPCGPALEPRPCDGKGGTGIGVVTLGSLDGADIKNGTIRYMASDGVNIASNTRLEQVRLIKNSGNGATLGRGSLVINCSIGDNYGHGIFGDHVGLSRGAIIGNIITFNGHIDPATGLGVGTGITVSSETSLGGLVILDNAITDNASYGIDAGSNADAGYGRNVIRGNNGGDEQVNGGTDMGQNH